MSDSEPATSDSLNLSNSPLPLLPWPSYRKYFTVIKSSENSKNLTVKCVLCQPATKILSVGISSASNLKKHITKLHSHCLKLLTESIEAQKRPRDESDLVSNAKQLRLDIFKDGGRTMPAISQLKMDKLVLDFVINDLQPFSIVDRPGFRKLIEGIRPDRQLITRKPLMGHINQAFEDMKKKLILVLSSQDLVCTTADCWTAFNR